MVDTVDKSNCFVLVSFQSIGMACKELNFFWSTLNEHPVANPQICTILNLSFISIEKSRICEVGGAHSRKCFEGQVVAKDLVKTLLAVNAEYRLSADDILKHGSFSGDKEVCDQATEMMM